MTEVIVHAKGPYVIQYGREPNLTLEFFSDGKALNERLVYLWAHGQPGATARMQSWHDLFEREYHGTWKKRPTNYAR